MNTVRTILAAGMTMMAISCADKSTHEMDYNALPLITVEEHITSQEIIDANAKYAYLKPKPTGKMAEAMMQIPIRATLMS